MHFLGQASQLIHDIRQFAIDYLWKLGLWSFDNGREAKYDTTQLKVLFEVIHECEPCLEYIH